MFTVAGEYLLRRLRPISIHSRYLSGCDFGLVDAGYSCYQTEFGLVAVKAYSGDYTYDEAIAKCSEDGLDVKAELPAPLSQSEHYWYYAMATELGIDTRFWLGINDRDVEGEFRNQHGSPHNFFMWGFTEPSDDRTNDLWWGEEDCVQVPGWDDTDCLNTNDILCTYVEGKALNSIKE